MQCEISKVEGCTFALIDVNKLNTYEINNNEGTIEFHGYFHVNEMPITANMKIFSKEKESDIVFENCIQIFHFKKIKNSKKQEFCLLPHEKFKLFFHILLLSDS